MGEKSVTSEVWKCFATDRGLYWKDTPWISLTPIKKNAPLAPSNSWVLQNWWCGYKDMKWHQERQRSPCSPRWTSCWWDSAWRKHRSCKYTLIPGKVSIFNLKVLCFWLTLCWNSKRHRQDCCCGNILSKETTVDLITLYFLHVNTSALI